MPIVTAKRSQNFRKIFFCLQKFPFSVSLSKLGQKIFHFSLDLFCFKYFVFVYIGLLLLFVFLASCLPTPKAFSFFDYFVHGKFNFCFSPRSLDERIFQISSQDNLTQNLYYSNIATLLTISVINSVCLVVAGKRYTINTDRKNSITNELGKNRKSFWSTGVSQSIKNISI